MNKFWRIYLHEYKRHVLRRRFILVLLSVPLWIAFAIVMGVVSVLLSTSRAPVGYVDQAGLIATTRLPDDSNPPSPFQLQFIAYPGESEARAALEAKKIQAFFVLPPDYRASLDSRLVYLKKPDNTVYAQFSSLLRYNLLQESPKTAAVSIAAAQRVYEGDELVIQATQEDRQMANNDWFKIAAPIAAAVFLMTSVFTSGGYLMQAVVEEKENRTMELLATSASPGQIMSGKTAAMISVGLTQILVWSAFPLLMIALASPYVPFMQNLSIDGTMIAMILLTTLPTFVLIAALMATIGAAVTEAREGQQVLGLVTLPVVAPWMLISVIFANPGGPLAVAMSFFPLTAAMTMLMRLATGSVPPWQVLASTGLLILSALGALWLSGRVFRMGMLRYGKRLGWKDIWQAAFPWRAARKAARAL